MQTMYLTLFSLTAYLHFNVAKDIFLKADMNSDNHNDFDSVANCIVKISEIDIYYKPIILILEKEIENVKETAFIDHLVDVIVKKQWPMIVAADVNSLAGTEFRHSNIITVVYFNSCDSFSKVMKYIEEKHVNYLIIVDIDLEKKCINIFKEIGKHFSLYSITFIVKDSDSGAYKVISFVPEVDGDTCDLKDDIPPTYINRCVNGTINKITSFPVKNPNFQKCPLRIGLSHMPPYSVIKNATGLTNFDKIDEAKGSDVELLKIMAKFFNATLHLHYVYKHEENAYILSDFIKFLLNGSLDACAGGMVRIFGDVVEYSGVYNRQSVFWIYSAERAHRSWSIFAGKIKEMYVFIIFYIFHSICWKLFSLFDDKRSCFGDTLLYSFGAMLGTASLQEAKTMKMKILNIFYMLMTIYLSFYTSAKLYAFLTIQQPPELFKTNEDIMNSGRTPILNPKSKNFTLDATYIKYSEHSLDCQSFADCEKAVVLYNAVTLVIDGVFYSFQESTAVSYEARVLRTTDDMLTMYHEMLIRKDSSIVVNFQKVLMRLFDAGICDKLYYEAIGSTVVSRAESFSKNIKENSYSCQEGCEITLVQAAGIFYFWLCGCFLSSIVFIFELFWKRLPRFQNVIVL